MNNNKERYKIFCEEHPEIPLFMQHWWMEAASVGKEWDVLFYEENQKIKGCFVYLLVKKMGFKFIFQPELTQYGGIWIDYPPNITPYQKLKIEKRIMATLIEQIDNLKFTYFEQNCHHSVTNWLPFYWKNYKQYTRYTYQIRDLSDLNRCFENFSGHKRRLIRKAQPQLKVRFDTSFDFFYEQASQNAIANRQKLLYSKELFGNIFEKSYERNQSCLLTAFDNNENMHAGIFFVWDSQSAYYLLATINPKFNDSGAYTLLMWEAIKFSANKVNLFDFEGSIVENIENSYSQFGTIQTPYFHIYKHNSLIFKILIKCFKK